MEESGSPKRTRKRDDWGRPEGGLQAVWQFVRGVPDRMRRPESLLMLMALLASIGAHMPPYVGLGALADYFQSQDKPKAALPPSEVSFEVAPSAPPAEPPPVDPPPEPERKRAEKPKPKPKQEQPEPKPEELKKPDEPKVAVVELPRPALTPPPPPPPQQRKQSITQKSEDPNVEPPPDAKYLAEESRRVEEETVASVTSETKNDPDTQAAAPQAAGPEKSGDSLESERGAEKGAQQEQMAKAESKAQQPPAPEPPAMPEPPQQQKPSQSKQSAQEAKAEAPTIIHDPMGSFVLAPSQAARSAQKGQEARTGARASAQQQPNLKVSWRSFEQTFGSEQLAQDRMPKEAKRRGAGREKRWAEFRAAVENYVAGVKPGNTTALNAAADPFAAYLAAFHRNLHIEFVHEFIDSLPVGGELGDPELVTKVEIVVNPDGTLDRVGVVSSSGNLMYDFGAFNAVQRGAPYPPPPEKIRSPDGRTYLRWALHRNESQCGTWNAEPFILKTPPRSPNDPQPDNVSPFRPGGDTKQGKAPQEEPSRPSKPGSAPAVEPGETLGAAPKRVTGKLASLLLPPR